MSSNADGPTGATSFGQEHYRITDMDRQFLKEMGRRVGVTVNGEKQKQMMPVFSVLLATSRGEAIDWKWDDKMRMIRFLLAHFAGGKLSAEHTCSWWTRPSRSEHCSHSRTARVGRGQWFTDSRTANAPQPMTQRWQRGVTAHAESPDASGPVGGYQRRLSCRAR